MMDKVKYFRSDNMLPGPTVVQLNKVSGLWDLPAACQGTQVSRNR
jgi:hypothetical protein